MFEIESCYRIIFEAMLEDSVFQGIADRIEEYTKAGIAFVTERGEVLACSGIWAGLFPVSAHMEHLTFEDYRTIYKHEEIGGRYRSIMPVYGGKLVIGYVVLIYEKQEERELFQELGTILTQNVKRYFEEKQKQYDVNQPLKEHMAGWMIFEEDAADEEGEKYPEGPYIIVLFCKRDGKLEEMAVRLRKIWNCMHIYEAKDEVFVLLYQVKKQDESFIYSKIEAEKIRCCVSERFSRISLCRTKKDILSRMAWMEESRETAALRREKEWSMRGMYTYASFLIEKAGLRDYSIERLLLEDEKNNTELYYSLKIYLLCGNNVTLAAKKLHIHRNTLVYRLKKIREYVDGDINDYETSRELLAFIMMNDIAEQNTRSKNE